MKTALLTLNVGDVLRENSRSSFHAAAKRWGCDYLEITDSDEAFPHLMKLKAFELCDADRIFYVDADTVISASCPSPFARFPEDAFVAVDNQQDPMTEDCRRACADNIARDFITINQALGLDAGPTYPKSFVNSGVWLASRELHAGVLATALETARISSGLTEWKDQSALNHALIMARTAVLKADAAWNCQFPPDTGAGPMTRYIYHWAGGENRERMDRVNWRSFRAEVKIEASHKPRLLWIGDAGVDTGFARVTHNVLGRLARFWDVHCIGINYHGDPHSYPYPIYPATLGGDLWGVGRFAAMVDRLKPDAVCVIQDPWIVPRFLQVDRGDVPLAAYIPVDATNQPPEACRALNRLDLAIFYTHFGEAQCRLAGFEGRAAVIPHGVDLDLYYPIARDEARAASEMSKALPKNAFIIGNVNRNSPRKRQDLTIAYVAEWIRRVAGCPDKLDNVYLYLHCAQVDPGGWNLQELAWHYGIGDRLIIPDERVVTPAKGLPEDQMALVYSSFDVQVSTTLGEGWGLAQIEGMGCGVVQICPYSSALGEWAAAAAWLVPCTNAQSHQVINTVGAVPDKDAFIAALDRFYYDAELRREYGRRALECARRPEYRWESVAMRFHEALTAMVERKKEERNEIQKTERLPAA